MVVRSGWPLFPADTVKGRVNKGAPPIWIASIVLDSCTKTFLHIDFVVPSVLHDWTVRQFGSQRPLRTTNTTKHNGHKVSSGPPVKTNCLSVNTDLSRSRVMFERSNFGGSNFVYGIFLQKANTQISRWHLSFIARPCWKRLLCPRVLHEAWHQQTNLL